MRHTRPVAIIGVTLVALIGILAWATRRTETGPQPLVNPSASYPASTFDRPSGELPAYASRPPVRVIEQPRPRATQPTHSTRPYADRSAGTAYAPPRRVEGTAVQSLGCDRRRWSGGWGRDWRACGRRQRSGYRSACRRR